jgi:hypothetical protein
LQTFAVGLHGDFADKINKLSYNLLSIPTSLPVSGGTKDTKEIIKMKIRRILLAGAMFFPVFASAGDWSKEQLEVLKFEEACISAKSADELLGCFHEDFVGWGQGSTVPTSKVDRMKSIVDGFKNNESESILFKPVSVIVKGNMAIISYIDSRKSTNKTTNEVEYSTFRWTDVCLKDGGKWYWISDHGVDITKK